MQREIRLKRSSILVKRLLVNTSLMKEVLFVTPEEVLFVTPEEVSFLPQKRYHFYPRRGISFVTPGEVSLPALIVEEELGNTVDYVYWTTGRNVRTKESCYVSLFAIFEES